MCLDEHQVALVISLQVVNIHPGFQVSFHRYVASPESDVSTLTLNSLLKIEIGQFSCFQILKNTLG